MPFEPRHMGDLRKRLDELASEVEDGGHSEIVRGHILVLITKSELLLHYDPLGTMYMLEAVNFLHEGDLRACLDRFKFALDSFLPN